MARKKKAEEHENHERWLVSYADFITLLFAFFVVMYSMSSVNEGKYRVLSNSMVAAFSPTTRSLNPIQIGELVRSPPPQFPIIMEIPKPINLTPLRIARENPVVESESQGDDELGDSFAMTKAEIEIEAIANDVLDYVELLVDEEQVVLRKTPLWLEIEIRSNILFNSGSADLADEAELILSRLGGLFKNFPNRIIVEGFTDNRPIQSPVYPSNWELSSARAAAVIRLFETYGVDSVRMSSVGYGEFQPSYDNESELGRARNRKVIIVVMANIKGENIQIPADDIEAFIQRGGS